MSLGWREHSFPVHFCDLLVHIYMKKIANNNNNNDIILQIKIIVLGSLH